MDKINTMPIDERTPEQKKKDDEELEQLEQMGLEIDELVNNEKLVRKYKQQMMDDKYFLYRLPLTDEERKTMYNAIMKEHNKNKMST